MPALDASALRDALPPGKGELRLLDLLAPGFVHMQDNSRRAVLHGGWSQLGSLYDAGQHMEWAGSRMVPILYGAAAMRAAARSVQVLRP
jgi:hypothetical protein